MSGQAYEECSKTLLNEMIYGIHRLAMLDVQPSVYDRIWESCVMVGFFYPPTTHLVANIEDLTEVLLTVLYHATNLTSTLRGQP